MCAEGERPQDIWAAEALALVPKLLTLQDRDPFSPTYGCFDRNYWHYKIVDFPSGMAQEFVYPLALAWATQFPGNRFHHEPAIAEWVHAGMRFAMTSAHPDGACDDYFPFEKAGGATAFSLLACLESYALLEIRDPELEQFFARRASWLAGLHESGRLSNHQALIALCLLRAGSLLRSDCWEKSFAERVEKILGWQHEEGWFPEYEGCDLGYLSLTLSLLIQIDRERPNERIKQAVRSATRLLAEFVHPDGSFGGEYTSRNTYNYFPHGFEIAKEWMPEGLAINDRILDGLRRGRGACYADDHILGHHAWSYLLAFREYAEDRPSATPRPVGRKSFPGAGLLVERRSGCELYLALNKGGSFKFFRDGRLVASDTQVTLGVGSGKRARVAVAHLVGAYPYQLDENSIEIRGEFGWSKHKKMTPFRLVALRGLMFTVGRFNPDLVRKLLQRLLITGKSVAPFRFCRRMIWEGSTLRIRDEISADTWTGVERAATGSCQTSIYVVMSKTFQEGQFQPWTPLALPAEGTPSLLHERVI